MNVFADPNLCPICGSSNSCVMAAQTSLSSTPSPSPACWCESEYFPQAIFTAIPAAAKNKACLCPNCLARLKTDTQDPTKPLA